MNYIDIIKNGIVKENPTFVSRCASQCLSW